MLHFNSGTMEYVEIFFVSSKISLVTASGAGPENTKETLLEWTIYIYNIIGDTSFKIHTTIGAVELDAKVIVGTTWIVTCCQYYSASCLILAYQAGYCRC